MKNKKLLIIIISAVVLVLAAVGVTRGIILGGSQEESSEPQLNLSEYITASEEQMKIAIVDMSFKEGDMVVRTYKKEVDMTSNLGVKVTETNGTLDITKENDFVYKGTSETLENINRAELINVSVSDKYYKTYEIKDGVFTGVVESSKLDRVIGSEAFANSDATIIITLGEGVITTITLSYTTIDGFEVNATMTYTY